MDWQQIIFIVLGILYFLFRNNTEKEQPKRKPNRKPSSGGGSTTSLEDILRELTGEAQKSTRKQPEPKEIVIESEVPLHRREVPKRERMVIEPIQVVHLDEGAHDETHEPISFDLKQAIINDAILNRPQW